MQGYVIVLVHRKEEEKPGQNGAVSPQLRVSFGSLVLVVRFLEKKGKQQMHMEVVRRHTDP